jgi:hypothetical protein
MANLVISGDTSGSVTLAAPAVSGTTVLTLPTTTGTLVVTGGAQTIEFADGTVSAPSITNSGDTNTGIFFPAADTIAFTEGGVESMRITSAGNLGVGTDAPTVRLDVRSGTGVMFNVQESTSGDSRRIRFSNSGTVNTIESTTGSGSTQLAFAVDGTERMRIDSSGNVGINTTTPTLFTGYKTLSINGSTNGGVLELKNADVSTGLIFCDSQLLTIRGQTSTPIVFQTNGANERMRIDSSGNVGIGVTPSAWGSGPQAIQNSSGAIWQFGSSNFYVGQNYYFNGTNRIYTTTAEATEYQQGAGTHRWFTAPSGTAGTTATFSERMRIDSSGNLLVGVTSGNGKVRIKQSADSHNNTLVIENFGNTNTWSFLVGSDNNLYLGYNGTSKGNFNNSTGAYTSTSDLRLKKNIETISHGLESVLALNPVSYNFKDETDESQQHLGFIAQEAQDILPSSVSAFADGTLGMDKQEIIPVLVKAIQELNAKVTALEKQLGAK